MTAKPWEVFAIASGAVFIVSVDATIAVAAFPALRGAFADDSPGTLSWVLNAYTIFYAALLAPAGRLVDLHGAKRLFLSSYLFLLGIWHYSQGLTGLAVTPGPLVVVAVAIASGRLVARVGHRAVLVAGGLLYASAQAWLAWHITSSPDYLTLWFSMQILGGTSVGLVLVGLSGAAVASLPPARFGVGGAVNNAVRQLGGVFGTALAVMLVGQINAEIGAFRTSFLCLGLIGALTSLLSLPLPRDSGRLKLQTVH